MRWDLRRLGPGVVCSLARRLCDCLVSGGLFEWSGPLAWCAIMNRIRGRYNRVPTAAMESSFSNAAGAGTCIFRCALGPPGGLYLEIAFPLFLALCGLRCDAGGGTGRQDARLDPDTGRLCRLHLTSFCPPPGGTNLGILDNGGPTGDTGRDTDTDG